MDLDVLGVIKHVRPGINGKTLPVVLSTGRKAKDIRVNDLILYLVEDSETPFIGVRILLGRAEVLFKVWGIEDALKEFYKYSNQI